MAKILVIENEMLVRENLLELLEAESFVVIPAANGREGVEMAIAQQPDLILCDIMMPELDGYQVLKALRQHPLTTTIPFIFLTAKVAKADFRQGMELGADDYLTKPFTRQELLGAIASRLAKQNSMRSRGMKEISPAELSLETSLREALERDELQLHYQPQVHLTSGEIIGAEALVRWQHPEKGLVSPVEFIPLAEATGLIIPIGEWVLRTACQQAKVWHSAGFADLRVSVNLSSSQFAQPQLSQRIIEILTSTGLNPNNLELEITESLLVKDIAGAIAIFSELQSWGIHIAIDDFGTGYSSLNYLKQFPLNNLKIDRCFIRNINGDPANIAITTAVIQMAHNLNLEVIAEGVETEAELLFLSQHGCDAIQGYFFSRPLPVSEFEELLFSGKRLPLQICEYSGSPFKI
jgi:EAL domain-containing protein (putative c-di-GMP-specific phosphodiesterase class I)